MVIGNRSSLSLEFHPRGEGEGEIYMFVSGVKIGLEGWLYDLNEIKSAFLYEITDESRRYYPSLIEFSAKEISQLFYCVWDDYADPRCERFKMLNIGDRDIGKIFFHVVPYLFDRWGVCLVQAEEVEKIMLINDEDDIYLEQTLGRGGFYSIVRELIGGF